jgi:hypothetical protein
LELRDLEQFLDIADLWGHRERVRRMASGPSYEIEVSGTSPGFPAADRLTG